MFEDAIQENLSKGFKAIVGQGAWVKVDKERATGFLRRGDVTGGTICQIFQRSPDCQNAVLQAARRARQGARLRQTDRRVPDQGSNPEPLHGPRNDANSARGVALFNGSGDSTSA